MNAHQYLLFIATKATEMPTLQTFGERHRMATSELINERMQIERSIHPRSKHKSTTNPLPNPSKPIPTTSPFTIHHPTIRNNHRLEYPTPCAPPASQASNPPPSHWPHYRHVLAPNHQPPPHPCHRYSPAQRKIHTAHKTPNLKHRIAYLTVSSRSRSITVGHDEDAAAA